MADMREVYSTRVARIGYDDATGELTVEWQKGKTSVYSGVPADVADETMRSPSIGEALREGIIGTYSHRYV